ncbi:MAG: AzlD domain-containing protein [Proteobacteria bacterium]|nr:AzlD domain-containing protein [Pseudomonadota bacterium]
MTWAIVLSLAIGTYALKSAGPILLSNRQLPPRAATVVSLVPVALLAALALVQTVQGSDGPVLDARVAALVSAFFALALRAPFAVVVLLAMATAAAIRIGF